MISPEKKDLCVSTLADTCTKNHNGCSGIPIFIECTKCDLYYLNLNKRKSLLDDESTTEQK